MCFRRYASLLCFQWGKYVPTEASSRYNQSQHQLQGGGATDLDDDWVSHFWQHIAQPRDNGCNVFNVVHTFRANDRLVEEIRQWFHTKTDYSCWVNCTLISSFHFKNTPPPCPPTPTMHTTMCTQKVKKFITNNLKTQARGCGNSS